jgi:HlyD family type I secretion membrane fusion protein
MNISAANAPRAPTDGTGFALFGYAVIGFGIFGFIIWAVVTPLASAVIAAGVVKVDTSRKAVQHLEGGVVEEVLVRDGDVVNAGDVLLRLDATRAQAQLSIIRGTYYAGLAQRARLTAERDELKGIKFPAELTVAQNDPTVAEAMMAQKTLFEARRSSLQGQLEILDQQIVFLRQQIVGLESQQRAKEDQIDILASEIRDLRDLLAQGLTEKTRILALEREHAKMVGERGEHLSQVATAKTQIGETELRKFQLQKSMREEVVADLKQLQTELLDLTERLTSAQYTVDHTDIRAPVNGIVVDLQTHTIGGVIGPGQTVLEIVPLADRLIIEAKVQPQDIEGLQVGLAAGVKLTAYKSRSTPELAGEVVYVAPDIMEDERTGQSYFITRIEVSDEEMARLDGTVVRPGMMADVFIRTGERTPADYLLQPLTDSFRKAWREN